VKRTSMSIRFLTILAGFTLCVFTISARQVRAVNTHAEDEAAIRENVRQMEAGWNTKQGALFAKPFAPDADYVVINGIYIQGRTAIEKVHQQILNTVFKNTTLRLSIKKIRFLRPEVAVVHVTGHRNAPANERELVSDAFMTMVMTREKQGWRIAAFQNTQIVANPQR